MGEETQRLNDLSKGNHLLRVTGGPGFSGPLSQPGRLLIVLLLLPSVIFHLLTQSSPRFQLVKWSVGLCLVSSLIVCCKQAGALRFAGRDRDLFLFSSPDLPGLVLSIWSYLVFSPESTKKSDTCREWWLLLLGQSQLCFILSQSN